jgi:serine/threonine-protein kinase
VLQGRFRVDGLISRGGMGAVFKGTDLREGRPVAIKFLTDRLRGDEEVVTRFLREAQATASLDHPAVIPVYAVGEEQGRYFFVMKYLAGRTVTQLLRAKGRLPLAQTLHIIAQIAEGLGHVHARGFVHRDVKPSNIMVEVGGKAVLLDFGILRILDTRHTHTGLMAGTPEYMAPEQAKDAASADARSDLYALGATVFEMLTGRLPFAAESTFELLLKHHGEAPPLITTVAPDLPPGFDGFMAKALAKDPGERYQTAADFKEALLLVSGLGADTATPEVAPPRASPSTPQGAPLPTPPASSGPPRTPPSQRAASAPPRAPTSQPVRLREPSPPPPSPVSASAPALRAAATRRRPRWGILLAFTLLALWGALVVGFFLLRYGKPVVRRDSVPRSSAVVGPGPSGPAVPASSWKPAGTGRITVTSTPSRAVVRAGAIRLGRTPLSGVRIATGEHEITVEAPGHRPFRRQITVAEDRAQTLDAALEPLPAILKVYTFKEGAMTWASIFVDGKALGSSPILGYEVAPGTHHVVARRPGYRHARKEVEVKAGEEKRVELDLLPP